MVVDLPIQHPIANVNDGIRNAALSGQQFRLGGQKLRGFHPTEMGGLKISIWEADFKQNQQRWRFKHLDVGVLPMKHVDEVEGDKKNKQKIPAASE